METLPVTEATPIFRNFYISNVVCNGAKKAVFVRGLPEMPVRNIHLSDLVIKADDGIQCLEAADVHFNNVFLQIPSGAKPMQTRNATNITRNNCRYTNSKNNSTDAHAF